MPVIKCANGFYRIGNGPCIYKSKKKALAAYRGYLYKTGGEAMNEQVELSKTELQKVLDVTIKNKAAWVLRSKKSTSIENDDLNVCAQKVYDEIVGDFTYNDNLVKATRAVEKFGVSYVRKIIKSRKADLEKEIAIANSMYEHLKSISDALYEKAFSKAALGSGARFDACVKKIGKKYGEDRAKKICAAIGRKKYGKSKFQKLGMKGKK